MPNADWYQTMRMICSFNEPTSQRSVPWEAILLSMILGAINQFIVYPLIAFRILTALFH